VTPTLETAIRLGCFVGILALMATWEFLAPRRKLVVKKPLRWASNLALVGLNSLLLRLAAPLSTVAMAIVASENRWGLLNQWPLPPWLAFVLAVVALDLAIYLQHVLFHAVPILWRLHMVHHADLDFDVTTGLRFHTIEILVSSAIRLAVVAALGAGPWAVVVFEVLLNGTSMFNHGNVRLPRAIDRVLRLVVVTPEMHRVHHSVLVRETNSNFGFNLPWWDFLFGTYRSQPERGHEGMTIGISHLRDERRTQPLHRLLLMPFTGSTGDYPLNRRSGENERTTPQRESRSVR
jgi:sterol desaturase/sphingolipid hydroxylase (fatty acid hydroxylase superfamily)